MTPMAQLSFEVDAIPSDPRDGLFIEDLTRCPSVRGHKRVPLGSDISRRGIVKPSCGVFFQRTPKKGYKPALSEVMVR
jgi:hypothetical protein